MNFGFQASIEISTARKHTHLQVHIRCVCVRQCIYKWQEIRPHPRNLRIRQVRMVECVCVGLLKIAATTNWQSIKADYLYHKFEVVVLITIIIIIIIGINAFPLFFFTGFFSFLGAFLYENYTYQIKMWVLLYSSMFVCIFYAYIHIIVLLNFTFLLSSLLLLL